MIEYYQAKFDYLQRHRQRQGMCWCPIAWERFGVIKNPNALHHTKVHNMEWTRDLYPLLLNSMMNLTPVWNPAHIQYPSWGKVSDIELENLEAFLRRHPVYAMWVNNLVREPLEVAVIWTENRSEKGI